LRIVSVVGTKKSGKTTVIERLLPELQRRGLRVGTLKLIHHESFTIHTEGRDTARHWEAGAEFSLALAPGETALVRRTGGGHDTLEDVEGLVPEGTDVLLCEGLVVGRDDVRTVVCAVEEEEARTLMGELEPITTVVAVSGVVAKGINEIEGMAVFDVMADDTLDRLAELVIP
jgi:molybdopterin-guanine dinucleotide biosynthesis protein B